MRLVFIVSDVADICLSGRDDPDNILSKGEDDDEVTTFDLPSQLLSGLAIIEARILMNLPVLILRGSDAIRKLEAPLLEAPQTFSLIPLEPNGPE